MEVRIESTALSTGGPQSTKEDKQAKDYLHRSGQAIDPAGNKGGAGDSRKVKIEVDKANPTKVAIVLLSIRDPIPKK